MDAFGDDFTTAGAEVDPAAEFLAREQDQLAGLEDDLLAEPNGQPSAEPAPAVQEGIFSCQLLYTSHYTDEFGA
jgi:hypothetical protein